MNKHVSRGPLARGASSSGRVARQSDPTLKDVQSATPANNDTGIPKTPSGVSVSQGRTEEKRPGTEEKEGLYSGLKEILG